MCRHLCAGAGCFVALVDYRLAPEHKFPKGFPYLVVVMDWVSRAVLAWRLSNTLGAEFCVEALEEALFRHGQPEIFNTNQGSQFTSDDFTGTL